MRPAAALSAAARDVCGLRLHRWEQLLVAQAEALTHLRLEDLGELVAVRVVDQTIREHAARLMIPEPQCHFETLHVEP